MAFFHPCALPGQTEKRIVFHCGSGMRSEKVARAAIDSGIAKIAHMEGGFGAWKGSKKPYIGTNMATGAPHRIE
jgi:rhodanese-related sulfurtransferase